MPTPNKAIDILLRQYNIDSSADEFVEQFFETLQSRFTKEEIEEIGEFLLAAESSEFDCEKMAVELPIGKEI